MCYRRLVPGEAGALPRRTRIRLQLPIDLRLSHAPLRRAGPRDPAVRIQGGELVRATWTPLGPACGHYRVSGSEAEVTAWGEGADWLLERAPVFLGQLDRPTLVPAHPLVAELDRRFPGLRIARTDAVFEVTVPTVFGQKVTGWEAARAYRLLLLRFGELAPGPFGLRLPPPPSVLAGLPSWEFHRLGVERRRASTLKAAAISWRRLEEVVGLPFAAARRRLLAFPGLGAWSAAEIGMVALGDADAVSVGDFHLPHMVAWALAGEARGSDQRMLELLQPYAGQRGRVLRLISAAGIGEPGFGPRKAIHDIARM